MTADPPSWEVYAEQSGLNPLWLLTFACNSLVSVQRWWFSISFLRTSFDDSHRARWWTQVCGGLAPSRHLLFRSLYRWNPGWSEVLEFSCNYYIVWLGRCCVLLGTRVSTQKTCLLTCLSRNGKLRDGKLVRGKMCFSSCLHQGILSVGIEGSVLGLQFLWRLAVSCLDRSSLSPGGGSRMTLDKL